MVRSVVVVHVKLEEHREKDGENQIDLLSQVHGVDPNIELKLVSHVRPVEGQHLNPELREHSISGENLMLVCKQHKRG
jgi:hypothetical protein